MRHWKRALWILLGIMGTAVLAFALAWLLIPLGMDRITGQSQTSAVFDRDGKQVTTLVGKENRTSIKLSSIPADVQNAFIAAEDARFFEHPGIDLYRVFGALSANLRSRDYSQGASTITQQIIKLTMLTSDKTITRKLTEMLLALKLEREMDKQQILETYLNTVYFGAGAYGLQAAARTYFGVDADKLTLPQGALLAAVIKSPSGYAPDKKPDKALKRRNMILSDMAGYQFISQSQADAAMDAPIQLADLSKQQTAHPWFVDQTIDEAAAALRISVDELLSGGYSIHTTLDRQVQASAESLFANAKNFPANAKDGTKAQAALVALDPDDGAVLALIGGRSYDVMRGLNRATQIERQPGSALKPISLYAAAVDRYGYLPVSMVEDTQRDFGNGYSPRNVGNAYYGTVTLRESLARSLNAASVDLLTKIDVQSARKYAAATGLPLNEKDDNLALALGSVTNGVSPMQLCNAYAPLANGGYRTTPNLVTKIVDSDGKTVYRHQTANSRIMKAESAYMITSMLESAAQWGSAAKLNALGAPVAGKTGTAGMEGGNRDIWTVGYTPEAVVCAWMGFDKPDQDHKLPDSASGSNQPAALVSALLSGNKDKLAGKRFSMPGTLTEVLLDQRALQALHTPLLASAVTPKSLTQIEVFPRGKAPTRVSDIWKQPTRVFDLSGELTTPTSAELRFTSLQEDAIYRLYRIIGDAAPQMIAELTGTIGRKLSYVDLSTQEGAKYYVIPVHRELLDMGVTLEGAASKTVTPTRPFGFKDWVLFQTPAPTEEPVPIPSEQPLLFDPTPAPTAEQT